MAKDLALPKTQLLDASGHAVGHKFDFSGVSQSLKELEEIDPGKCRCIGHRVLLKVMEVQKITKGGIFLSDKQIEKELLAKCTAVLVSMGARAFEESIAAGEAPPKVGDTVFIAKYAGLTVRDSEYNLYRLTNDTDVAMVKE